MNEIVFNVYGECHMSYAPSVGKAVDLSVVCENGVAYMLSSVENVLKYLLEDNNNFVLHALIK